MTSVAVVGGAGFIGSHVVDLLAAGGARTLVIDDMSHPCGATVPPGVEVVAADAGSAAAADALLRFRPGALLHLAAKGGVERARREPGAHVAAVLASSVACFEAAAQAGCAAIVIASSGGAVYGDATALPATEDTPPAPRSAYGAEKVCEETYLSTYASRGVRTMALRYGNVYGPRQDGTGEAGVVAITATRLAGGLPPVVYGSGEQTRDFVFVADVARATVLALRSQAWGAVNVGTGVETSVLTVVEVLRRQFPGSPAVEHAPARLGEVARGALDARRAARLLGWTPLTSLDAGLADTARHFGAPLATAASTSGTG